MVQLKNNVCCLNPECKKPENTNGTKFCQSCGTEIVLLRKRYHPIKLLSDEGGFGRTYLAADVDKLNELCVIKQLAPKLRGTASLKKATELFEQEAKQLQELGEHDQIPRLLAYFDKNSQLYLIQQYVQGKTLDKLQKKGCWSEGEIRDFLNDILPVLEFIHEKKLIHRDIKPPNIMRREEDRKFVLIDFGASKDFAATVVNQGTQIGTFGYSPFEQLHGGEAYPASDLYSIGATCFYLLTKENLHKLFLEQGYQWADNWEQYLQQPISKELKQVLGKLLQKDIKNRYQSVEEVREDLNPSPAQSV
ncbi:MAG: serine/threonine protein kinase [Moorea sp. SIO2B7]|nr:serine/threonine protein kinase [Moorena sp. SIO2B7]